MDFLPLLICFVPLFPILFSYMRILRVCFSGSKQTRQKAVSTCTPHLVSLLNFSFGGCFEMFQSRFDMSGVPSVLRIILSLYFLIIQPLMNPVMYGLQMSKLRNICKHVLCYKLLAGSNYLVVKLACSDTQVNNIYGIFATALSILVTVLPILFSYMRILRVCFSGSKQTRFDMSGVPSVLRIILSLYFLIIQPLMNPVMYGLQMSKLRNICKHVLCYKLLAAYLHIGYLRYLYFMITAMLYIVIVVANTSLIVVICVNRSLHEPMYLFLCSLFVNELYGSTGLFPFLLVQILSDIHTVSAPLCFLQIFCLYTYGGIEFCNLAVMSYDRYLAICYPLQYNTRAYLHYSGLVVLLGEILDTFIFKHPFDTLWKHNKCLYCSNYLVVKLACSDTQVNNIYGVFATALSILVTVLPILFSYMRILRVCFSGSKQTRQKAVSTCTPHLVSLLNFSFGCSFEILQSRFDMSGVPSVLRIILSLYFLIIQPLMNPVMYGLQMSKLRNICKHVLCYKLLAGGRNNKSVTYLNIGYLKYLYFMITAMLYIVIVVANTSLIVVICVSRSLHEPMYLFLCSLFVNELYGSTGLFPFLLVQILSDIHTVSAQLCFLQMFCLYTYGSIEFSNLAVMSYDRYLAICYPLQYNTRMTSNKAAILIILVWLYSFVKFLITLSLNIRLTLCGNIIDSLNCNNHLVVKLACSDTHVNNIYGLFSIVLSILVPLFPILFSYMRILRVCFSGSKQTRQKAVSTCAPHLFSLLNFCFGCSFEILQSRFDMSGVPSVLRIILSLYFLIIQPLMNPVMYGLQMSKLRNICKHTLEFKCAQIY
ncbi:hypothetical protein F7725_021290 [Dissostichus mawsoni]|uniref:G-protein coupled receptors family 1 profile domain-containing protein n=1 Tax=Dissostichus mawsoni TaxID=36200 RepID=A0A7J5YFL9_DISMA|nr:hypothetical protein F7725_021290 [Dissostichus mawsoni]